MAGAESAAESGNRVRMMEAGIEPPQLQWRIVLDSGAIVFLNLLFPSPSVGAEADGDVEHLDPAIATRGTGRALVEEKRREDEVRTRVEALARWGWAESRGLDLMRRVLHRVDVDRAAPGATLADDAAAARGAVARSSPRRPVVRR